MDSSSDSSSCNMDPPGPGPRSKPRLKPRPKPAPDSVSMRSDSSKDYYIDFKESRPEEQSSYNMDPPGPGPRSKPRPGPAPDSVSMRSDWSKEWNPPNFKESRPEEQSSYNMDPPGPGPGSKPRPGPAPDSVSMRSDFSKDYPPDFTESRPEEQSSYNMDPPGPGPGSKRRPGPGPGSKPRPGPAPDSVSMRSDWSKDFPPNFKESRPEEQRPKPAPDSVSMRSDRSKGHPLNFREAPPEDQREPGPKEQLDAIFRRLEKDVLTFVKEQLQRLHRLLASDYPECSESEEEEQSSREVLNITLDFLRRMDQEQLAQRLQHKTAVGVCKDKLKSHLQQRFSRVFEGVAKAGDSAPLNQIYTELYITEGGASEVNQEHEVRLMESASRRAAAPEKTITCEDIFKARPHSPEPIRAVLTKGVAGVGKTVLTQKFSLDWAEGRANQELQLLFPFTFRELNVLRDTQFSLVELLHHFFSPSKALCSFQQLQVLFIFDGLDECRLPLDFSRTRVLTTPQSLSQWTCCW
ncbi:hypothetical protein WMY93_001047 [Mugilogobius chulae]|uniref:NACHT domain-containing protein n=1 Tax=Mugilogobius chulae TaxID=88201 RepID=A0AAW0QFY8_9GOBI